MDIPDPANMNLPEKEQKILQAAIKVFSEKGFSASTTSEIAKSAGIAEGTIFRYFKTKKDILRAVLIQALNLISGQLVIKSIEKILLDSHDKDLRTVLKEIIYDRMALIESIFPMARIILTEAMFHEDVRDAIYQNIISKAFLLFKDFYKKMQERGLIRSECEPEAVIRAILGNVAILVGQKMLYGDKFIIEDIDKEIDKVIDIILFGISKIRIE